MFTSTIPVQLEEEVSASSVRYGRHLSIWGSQIGRRTRMWLWGGKLEDVRTMWRQHFFFLFFLKIGSRSSVYSPESSVRKTGSYIYEEFMPTDGTDVKVMVDIGI